MKRRKSRYNLGLVRRINRRAWTLVVKRPVGTPVRAIARVERMPRGESALLALVFGRCSRGKMARLRLRLWHLHLEKSSTRTVQRRRRGYRGQPPSMGGAYRCPFAWKRVSEWMRR
jgi:hypothetical protein